MKKYIKIFLSSCLLIFGNFGQAQEYGCLFDTIQFEKISNKAEEYSLNGELIKSFTLENMELIPAHGFHFCKRENSEMGYIDFTKELAANVNCLSMINRLNSSRNGLTNLVDNSPLYCPGAYISETNCILDENGICSIQIVKGRIVCWGKGTLGYILDSGDTILRLCIVPESYLNSNLQPYLNLENYRDIFLNPDLNRSKIMSVLLGEIHGNECLIVYSADADLFYLFENFKLTGIYNPHKALLFNNKVKQTNPYVLVDKSLSQIDRQEVLRQSFFCQWIREIMVPADFYGLNN